MKCSLVGLAATLSLAIAQPARGHEAGTFTLSWQGPAGCPSRDELHAEITRLL